MSLKDKWLVALRSGEFEQGFGQLNKDKCFCCLGVLAEVAKFPKCNYGAPYSGGDEFSYCIGGSNHFGTFPPGYVTCQETLMKMNDDERKSFAEIADYIEEHVNVLFEEA